MKLFHAILIWFATAWSGAALAILLLEPKMVELQKRIEVLELRK